MTKQEHIEEMISAMAASNNPFVDVPIEIMPKVAEALYNAGYRKLPKDSVVLSREEQDRILTATETQIEELKNYIKELKKENFKLAVDNGALKEEQEQLESDVYNYEMNLQHITAELKQARKETAEKFAKLIEFHSISKRDESGYETFTISNLCMREILREEFGFTNKELETI